MATIDLDDLLLVERPEQLTRAQVLYLRDHPEILPLIGDRETVTTRHLWRILLLAVILVALSKVNAIKFDNAIDQLLASVAVDFVFEMGAALIGSVATVIFIQHQQKKQFIENIQFRAKLQQMIDDLDEAPGDRQPSSTNRPG